MSIPGWETLTCQCGSKDFTAVHALMWHRSQGSTNKQTGWQCAACAKRTNQAALINAAKSRDLQTQIDELEAQRADS